MYACTCRFTNAHTYTCVRIQSYVYTFVHIYSYIHMHIYIGGKLSFSFCFFWICDLNEWLYTYSGPATRVNESCNTHEWDMSHT